MGISKTSKTRIPFCTRLGNVEPNRGVMKIKMNKHLGAGLLAALSLALPVVAEDVKLADWDMGRVQCGDEALAEDLEGKVVVIEYWGTR